MKYLLTLSFVLSSVCYANAQTHVHTDTVVVNMLNFNTGEQDAALKEFNRNIQHYFNRNLRTPVRGSDLIQGYATVSFVVDKEGNVVNPLSPSMTNAFVGKEVLRVAKKFSRKRTEPLYRDGEPVVAKVIISVGFVDQETLATSKEEIHSKAALVVTSYKSVSVRSYK